MKVDLFCDSLEVGRLFQASTTFNYIVTNTAPRYTIERVMLFNIRGPGEGKSYANNVLNCQFKQVKDCTHVLHPASLQVQAAEERLRGDDRRCPHNPRKKQRPWTRSPM